MTDQLLPCPFCGGKNIKIYFHSYKLYYSIICGDCHSEGPKIDDDRVQSALKQAVEAWNTRK